MPRIKLPGTGLPDVPDDQIEFTVEVDRSRCTPPTGEIDTRLTELETNGFSTTLSRVVAFSGIHYEGAIEDHWNLGEERAKIQSAWSDIARWRPRAQGGRLVFTKRDNPAVQHTFSEIIGVGAGLLLARYLYARPYRLWRSLGHARLDYACTSATGDTIRVELRGRFDRNHWATARSQIEAKITAGSNFDITAGIIFAPRTHATPRAADFLVMDPPGDGGPADPHRTERDVLEHYAPYFEAQGFLTFGARLRELANAPEASLRQYFSQGDAILRSAVASRTSFQVNGEDYAGTAWEGVKWPTSLVGPQNAQDGCFFDGLASAVIDALRDGAIADIIAMDAIEGSGIRGNYVEVTLDDGRALAWAPTLGALLEHE